MDYAASLGLQFDAQARRESLRWEHYYFANSPELQTDSLAFPEQSAFWLNYSRRRLINLGCAVADADALAAQCSAHMRNTYRPEIWVPEEAPAVLAALQESGLILGVVSNRNEAYEKQIQEMGLHERFHFLLAAGEVNSYKPDARIFHAALERTGTLATETLFVGDNYYADVVGAQNAGLRPVLYDLRGLFPEVGCDIIRSFEELINIIK